MAENNLAVKVTADVADLQAKFAIAKANVNALTSEMNKLAKQSAAGLIDAAGSARLQQVSNDLLHARNEANEFASKLREAGVSLGGFGGSAKRETEGVGGAFEAMAGKVKTALQFTGIAVAIEALHKLAEVVTETAERSNQILNMADVLGVTTKQFEGMKIAADEAGIGAEQLFRAQEKLIKVLEEARDGAGASIEKLKLLGITNEQIGDKAFGTAQFMATLAGRLEDASTHAATMSGLTRELGARSVLAAEGIQQMGSNIQHWIDLADRANALDQEQHQKLREISAEYKMVGEQIENATARALVWSSVKLGGLADEAVEGSKKIVDGFREAEAAIERTLGVKPISRPDKYDSEPPPAQPPPKPVETPAAASEGKPAAEAAGAAAAVAVTKAADAEITKDTLDSIRDQIEATKNGSAERLSLVRKFYEDSKTFYGGDTVDKVKEAHRQLVAEERTYREEQQREAVKGASELISQTREKASEIMANESLSKAEQLVQVRDLYAQELQAASLSNTNIEGMREKRIEVERSLNEAITAINRNAETERKEIARTDAETGLAISRMRINEQKSILEQELSQDQISAARKLSILRDLSIQEEALNEQAERNRLKDLTPQTAAWEQVNNQILVLREKLNEDLAALDLKATEEARKQAQQQAALWKRAVDEIEGAESTMLSDLLGGRKTFAQSVETIMRQLVETEITNDIKAFTTRTLLAKNAEDSKKATEQGGFIYHLLAGKETEGAAGVAGQTQQVAAAPAAALPAVAPAAAPAGIAVAADTEAAEAARTAVVIQQQTEAAIAGQAEQTAAVTAGAAARAQATDASAAQQLLANQTIIVRSAQQDAAEQAQTAAVVTGQAQQTQAVIAGAAARDAATKGDTLQATVLVQQDTAAVVAGEAQKTAAVSSGVVARNTLMTTSATNQLVSEAQQTAAVIGGTKAREVATTAGLLNTTLQLGRQTVATITGQSAQTAAVVAGASARVAAQTAAAAQGKAAQAAMDGPIIAGDAAKAAAGAYSALAGIPIVGPVLAPVAAGVAFAAVSAYKGIGLEVGAWEIPREMQATLHPGESVVPKTFAQGMREAVGSGRGEDGGGSDSGGNSHTTYNIHAHDSASFEKYLSSQRNRGAIAAAVSKSISRGARLR